MIPDEIKQLFKDAQADKMGQSKAYQRLVENAEDLTLVEQYLVTPEQSTWLNERQLTLQKLIDGKYLEEDKAKIQSFLREWNTKLGVPWFQVVMQEEPGRPTYPYRPRYENRTPPTIDRDVLKKRIKDAFALTNEIKNLIKLK